MPARFEQGRHSAAGRALSSSATWVRGAEEARSNKAAEAERRRQGREGGRGRRLRAPPRHRRRLVIDLTSLPGADVADVVAQYPVGPAGRPSMPDRLNAARLTPGADLVPWQNRTCSRPPRHGPYPPPPGTPRPAPASRFRHRLLRLRRPQRPRENIVPELRRLSPTSPSGRQRRGQDNRPTPATPPRPASAARASPASNSSWRGARQPRLLYAAVTNNTTARRRGRRRREDLHPGPRPRRCNWPRLQHHRRHHPQASGTVSGVPPTPTTSRSSTWPGRQQRLHSRPAGAVARRGTRHDHRRGRRATRRTTWRTTRREPRFQRRLISVAATRRTQHFKASYSTAVPWSTSSAPGKPDQHRHRRRHHADPELRHHDGVHRSSHFYYQEHQLALGHPAHRGPRRPS